MDDTEIATIKNYAELATIEDDTESATIQDNTELATFYHRGHDSMKMWFGIFEIVSLKI